MTSIVANDLNFFSCASVPTDDASSTGGAIDVTMRVAFTQFGAAAKLSLTADGADAGSVDIVGRLASGVIASETMVLNGVTEVLSTNTYERLHSVKRQATSGTRTVTAKQGTGGSTIATIPPNEKGFHIQFQRSTSTGSTQTRNEKQFLKNINPTNALLGATLTLTNDPQAVIQIGVGSVGGTTSVANRTTAPGGVTFVDDNIAQTVPGTDLASTATVELWIQQTLAANAAAAKSTFTLQAAGSTT